MKGFELVVAGFNAETDESDDRVIWVTAESRDVIVQFIANNDLAAIVGIGCDLPDNLTEDDGIDFHLPLQANEFVAHLKFLVA